MNPPTPSSALPQTIDCGELFFASAETVEAAKVRQYHRGDDDD